MAKMLNWVNDKGETVWKGNDAFSRTASKTWRGRWPYGEITHVRMGRFACVISPYLGHDSQGKPRSEFVAAESYEDANPQGDGSILPGDELWESWVAGRLNTIGSIMSRLYSNHALYGPIIHDLKVELRYLLQE